MISAGRPAATFPVPMRIPFNQLGLPAKAQWAFKVKGERAAPDVINTERAYRFARKVRFGADVYSDHYRQAWEVVQDRFFPRMPFRFEDGELSPIQIQLRVEKGFADGDTARVAAFNGPDGWVDYRASVRMDGIDTPESNPSSKLTKLVQYSWQYYSSKFQIPKHDRAAAQEIIKARIMYLGKIAGAVTSAFHLWTKNEQKFVSLGPAYGRAATTPEMCNTLDLSDRYLRFIGRIKAGAPNQGSDLLAGFVSATLPVYMREVRRELFMHYANELNQHGHLLAKWRVSKPELYELFAIEDAPNAGEIFSKNECLRLSQGWQFLCDEHKEASNDLQTLLAFLGVAPPYLKYRGHMSCVDVLAERFSLGLVPNRPMSGLVTNNPHDVYMIGRPRIDEPASLMFSNEKWRDQLSDNKDLNPPDCAVKGANFLYGNEL